MCTVGTHLGTVAAVLNMPYNQLDYLPGDIIMSSESAASPFEASDIDRHPKLPAVLTLPRAGPASSKLPAAAAPRLSCLPACCCCRPAAAATASCPGISLGSCTVTAASAQDPLCRSRLPSGCRTSRSISCCLLWPDWWLAGKLKRVHTGTAARAGKLKAALTESCGEFTLQQW